jgi:hypothetical protein
MVFGQSGMTLVLIWTRLLLTRKSGGFIALIIVMSQNGGVQMRVVKDGRLHLQLVLAGRFKTL